MTEQQLTVVEDALQDAADVLRELYQVFSNPNFTDRHGHADMIKTAFVKVRIAQKSL